MKKIFLLAVVSFLTANLLAQFPGGAAPAGGAGKGSQALSNIGHVFGKVVDSTGKAISEASVFVLQSKFDSTTKKMKEVLLTASTTKSNGEFNFEDLPLTGIKLKITVVGFKEYQQPVAFIDPSKMSKPSQTGTAPAQMLSVSGSFDKDLGNVKLTADGSTLQGVTVTANKPMMKMDIDKKVFNVEKNIVSAGGTALDVMRNVPSVQVDIDGNVKLRNAAPQIYVDGRPTTLSLDQIPADAIESVEVITNPSAKYDASGGNAGILNIVLKKNKKSGYNGNIMAGVDKRGAVNGGGNFNIRQNKINLSAAVMVNQMKNKTTGHVDQTNFGDTAVHTYQDNHNQANGAFMFGRLGLDYFVTNKTTLSVAGVKVHGEFKPGDVIDIYTDSLFSTGTKSTYGERVTSGKREFNATGLQLGLKHSFAKPGEELTADANYFSGKNQNNALYTTSYYNPDGSFDHNELQHELGNGKNSFLTLQTDYTKPLNKNTTLETGLRAQLRNTISNNDTYLGIDTSTMVKVPNAASNYENHDNVYAAYATIKSSIKNFGYEAGLRAESSNYNAELTNSADKYENKYPISLFPSLFLSQKLNGKQELQFSYTRRVNRPNFFNLIPYTDRRDKLNVTQGNPDLKPEFTNSLEMSYGKTFKKSNNILASIYYKYTTDLITRYLTDNVDPVTGSYITTWVNANSSYSYGGEFTSVNYLTKWWDVTSNVNIYKSKINTDNISGTSQDAMWSWFGKVNSNFKLPSDFAIQLTGMYQSKTNLPVNNNQGGMGGPPMMQAQSASQGYIRSFWGMDAALKKSFLKDKAATVTLSVSDIFATRKQDQHSYSSYFVQDYYRINNPQMFKINFTYRFGKMDMSLFKKQNSRNSGTQDAIQMGGQ
jgi:outer membrane receptor protein involved in Fe transport